MDTTAPNRILGLLYDRQGGYFGLDERAAVAETSPGAVASALEAIQRRRHRLELSPAAGVRLLRPTCPDAFLIERDLSTARVGRSVICFDQVDSTNDVAWDSARHGDTDGLVVLAESQRRGRGRHGRTWVSAPAASILMSAVLIDPSNDLPREALTIAAGLAVAEGIEDATRLQSELKWPNDVLLAGAKVAGVLVESRLARADRTFVVGVGINVASAPAQEHVSRPTTCLAERAAHYIERIEVIRAVLRRLDAWVDRIARGQSADLRRPWVRRCGMINQRVRVRCGESCYEGRALDVSPLDGLVLCRDDGQRVHLPAAESTVLDGPE